MRWPALFALLLLLVACGREVPLPPQGEPAARARVTVMGTGLFRVDARTLAAVGWRAADPLALTMNDAPWPYQVHEDALYFYLPETVEARYGPQHALWLTYGAEQTAPPPLPTVEGTIPQLLAEQHLTQNEQYNPKYIGDPWFWRTLLTQEADVHELATPGREEGSVSVTLRVAGVTRAEHRIELSVEGRQVGTLAWGEDERYEETFTVELPAADTLTLSLLVPDRAQDGPVDISLLDEIIVRYPSPPLLDNGSFRGVAEEVGQLPVDSLGQSLIAWHLEPLRPLTVEQGVLAVPEPGSLAILERELAQPATLEPVAETPLPDAGADYLAIVAPPLMEAIEPLLAFHRAEGMTVLALTPQEVYDRYSSGTIDPLAIRALLQEAQERWQTKPRFILLVGDSTYDPAGYQSELPPAYLPSPFIQTLFGGETVSDNVLADLDEDGYPDVALGRLPARSPEQVAAFVQKRLAYTEHPEAGPWRERVLLVADGQEALFQQNSEQVRATLPAALESITVYPQAQSEAAGQLLPLLDEGSLIVSYVGHGSVQQWGRDALLSVESVARMRNGARLPIVIHMTCLTGLFSHPTQESLAESLLWAEQGGAIAVIAPSSLTLPSDQSPLNQAILQELLSPEPPTVGEALMRAKHTLPQEDANAQDILATFNLLGDPALHPLPPGQ